MASNAMTLYKLMILYMLNSSNYPLTNARIKSFLSDNFKTIKSDISATANYKSAGNGDYIVNLNINEYRTSLLSLSMSVPAENIAEKICAEWSKKSDDVYALLFNSLVLDKSLQ